ncbi:MAG TPA: DUF1156 domain-containing protein [Candidatus Udaeobacter sp.]|nr:DUF1156 domain-containing protein [Candidatus Udaeobacter sp.]
MIQYPKRLIEVDLPIKRISAHARREKSVRRGHISTLHIWWARRPLAACRAVICAALWPDPAPEKTDAPCPPSFIKAARREMLAWTSRDRQNLLSAESRPRFEAARQKPTQFDDALELRRALLDFIADFADWDNSNVREYLDTSRALTQAAHEALGGAPGTRPLVVDPFAGGGSIPLEALRVGADAFASDLNPVAVLINKVVLDYIPKYGQRLADEVRKWGDWVNKEAERELAEFYPKDPDGSMPIAYLWARTIQCEGPGCGAEVPLLRSTWLANKVNRSIALHLTPDSKGKRVDFQIIVKHRDGWVVQAHPATKIENPKFEGTVKRGSVTCPCCGYTTSVARVREQLKTRRGGTNDARLMCVITTRTDQEGRFYRLSTAADLRVNAAASEELERRKAACKKPLSLVPDEIISLNELRRISVPIYGMKRWGDLFSARQALALTTIQQKSDLASEKSTSEGRLKAPIPLKTCLAFAVDKLADKQSSFTGWKPTAEYMAGHTFARQAIGMVWDWCEANVFADASGAYLAEIEWIAKMIEHASQSIAEKASATVQQTSATAQVLPDDSAWAIVTDPPYYDAVPYAYLSDFFFVWLRRALLEAYPELFQGVSVPKEEEIVVDRPHQLSQSKKDVAFYERELTAAFADCRRVLRPHGVGVIVFASKTTSSWEAILQALISAGWTITASWPIDTEMETRLAAMGQARLASSVHLVCSPRENPDGSLRSEEIGDWRDVLQQLPDRIHEWMPRLAEEGVVGADAIFACLGPALEIFSRYSRVEKASGEAVTLKEYLEHVWAAVAKEALKMVFEGADTTGFEPDARLTAMWLWTLNAGRNGTADNADEEEEAAEAKKAKVSGFVLEYDAARKIAQGLGAHLEALDSVVEISGETARLLPVAERARYLFGKDEGKLPTRKKQEAQLDLFKILDEAAEEGPLAEVGVSRSGDTVLDRIHQTMILFAAGRVEAVRRYLVENGIGRDPRFWRLAQALSALYPATSEEKRWIDGVLAKKKGLGL